MSEHQQYLAEKEKIDFFIQQGYRITGVNEHLNGSAVEFAHPKGNVKEIVLIGNANARKYFASLLINQNQQPKESF